jgi:hypothetical protein
VRGDGLGGVTDAERDYARGHFGILFEVGVATSTDFGEKLEGGMNTMSVFIFCQGIITHLQI